MKKAANIGIGLAGCWALVVLTQTPRGEQIMQRVGRVLFPEWVTGERAAWERARIPRYDVNGAPMKPGQEGDSATGQ